MTEVAFTRGFWPSVQELDAVHRARVIEALNLFNRDPSHPNLHLKSLRNALTGLHSVRAGRAVRILMERRGETFIWLMAGMRRDVYDRAERGRFVVNDRARFMGFVEPEVYSDGTGHGANQSRTVAVSHRGEGPGILDHWTSDELRTAGLTEDEIETVRRIRDEYELLELGLKDSRLDLLLSMLEVPPSVFLESSTSNAEDLLRQAIAEFGEATGVSRLFGPDEAAALLLAPIEDWMVFLHPDQRRVVEARFSGPCRIRGAAGTGKTVVALHRAATLAARYPDQRILFVTFSEQLLPVLRNLFARLPSAATDRVDFHTVATLAAELSGEKVPLSETAAEDSFAAAVAEVVGANSPLAGLSVAYLRAEVEAVILGRGALELSDYLEMQRRGRKVGFMEPMKRAAWDLHLAWRHHLGGRDTIHALVSQALTDGSGRDRWRCAVVDEAQDLTMTQLALIRMLVTSAGSDREDGLTLCGDGAQKVRPGGYTLRQAGIEVRGRTTVLRVNYRTTAQIMDAAIAVAGAAEVVDLDEEFLRGEAIPEALRTGPPAELLLCGSRSEQIARIEALVKEAATDSIIGPGDVAILTAVSEFEQLRSELLAAGVETVDLTTYAGTPSELPKIGPWPIAKGLEFKSVIVTGCGSGLFPSRGNAGEWGEEVEERRLLEMSHLFIAMTRARDRLTLVAIDGAAPEISAAVERFSVS